MRIGEKRRPVPLAIRLQVALRQLADAHRQLGLLGPDEEPGWELDHDPALARRDVDPETGQHVPHQHAVNYLVYLSRSCHKAKTVGTGATTRGSDIGEIARERRVTKKQAAFRAALLAKSEGREKLETNPKGRKIRSPGFQKGPSKWPKRSMKR